MGFDALGGIHFMGVCVPRGDAHVRTGRKYREAWQDHRRYGFQALADDPNRLYLPMATVAISYRP